MNNLQSVIETCGVHPALGAEAGGWWIEQSPYELASFIEALAPLGIKTALEIGTGHKMGLARFMSEILGWKVVSVDIHQPQYVAPLVDLRISETRLDFPDTLFDLLIIDADHRYESVKADYEHYGKYARKVVMFHDIAGLRDCEGAAKFWIDIARTPNYEMKTCYHEIFVEGSGRCGIGWLDVAAVNTMPVESLGTIPDDAVLIDDSVTGLTVMVNPQPQIELTPADPPPSKKKPGRKPKIKNA